MCAVASVYAGGHSAEKAPSFSVPPIEPLSAPPDILVGERFQFEVTIPASGGIFHIPLSGWLNRGGTDADDWNKPYDWDIDWGDGTPMENIRHNGNAGDSGNTGAANTIDSPGIPHAYANSSEQTYTVTITPGIGSPQGAWLAAFGFSENPDGANAQANKNMLTKIVAPLTPLMTRTLAQIDHPDYAPPPAREWARAFRDCVNLKMGENFAFSGGWERIASVGARFAESMFEGCSGDAFTMNEIFNLPQRITSVGHDFAASMFYECYGSAFAMNDVFNLPQGVTSVGDRFARMMFQGCRGSAFAMNDVFNLPQGILSVGDHFASWMFWGVNNDDFAMNDVFNLPPRITSVGSHFARAMFYGCAGEGFLVNDAFVFPFLSDADLNKEGVLHEVFRDAGPYSPQTRTASSIIGRNAAPDHEKFTFWGSDGFPDRQNIPVNWGGDSAPGLENILSASYANLRFTDRFEGYVAAENARAIMVHNFGLSEITGVTAAFSYGGNFTVSEPLSASSIPPGGGVSLTIEPMAGLAPSEYADAVIIKADNCEDAVIGLMFSVHALTALNTRHIEIAAPARGFTPQASVSGAGYSGWISWHNVTDGVPHNVGRAFEGGKEYKAAVELVAARGHFWPVEPAITTPSGIVRNVEVTGPTQAEGNVLTFEVDYEAVSREYFQFQASIPDGDSTERTFSIPLGGGLDPDGGADPVWGKPYNWHIDWGDGIAFQTIADTGFETPQNQADSPGISHTYAKPGVYTITITPAGVEEAWLAAFGFGFGTVGAAAQHNKDKITRVLAPLTPLMTRTAAQTDGAEPPPSHEWAGAFYGCAFLSMGEDFTFSSEWADISDVGSNFAQSMFAQCDGGGFLVSNAFTFPMLAPAAVDKAGVFEHAFQNLGDTPPQTRAAGSIIGGNPIPASAKNTFSGSPGFPDRLYIHANWGGGSAAALTASPAAKAFPAEPIGYNPPPVETFTLQNESDIPIENIGIALKSGTHFTLGPLSPSSTALANGSLTFTAAPKTGFAAGDYADTVIVSMPGRSPLEIPLSFTVTFTPSGSEYFQFRVTVPSGGDDAQTFSIPLSGRLDNIWNKAYDWEIDWGDGSPPQNVFHNGRAEGENNGVANAPDSEGIPHTYAAAGTYVITVSPKNSENAWFGAFGFSNNEGGANAQANKDKIIDVIGPLTPLMTRTEPQLQSGQTPSWEWAYTFYGCTNLAMDDRFAFLPDWDAIETVGDFFAYSMFSGCSGTDFAMGAAFGLPPALMSVGDFFAYSMFSGCSGQAFTMNDAFTLPQGIEEAGEGFAGYMFSGCNGGNLLVNDIFEFPLLAPDILNRPGVFEGVFNGLGEAPPQTRLAASIIGGNDEPDTPRFTFSDSPCFDDLEDIPENWAEGGDDVDAILIISPTSKTFAREFHGYSFVEAQSFNVYNAIGVELTNVSVVFEKGGYFAIEPTPSTVPARSSFTITAAPRAGLMPGIYEDTIIISTSSSGYEEIPLFFSVAGMTTSLNLSPSQIIMTKGRPPVDIRAVTTPVESDFENISWYIDTEGSGVEALALTPSLDGRRATVEPTPAWEAAPKAHTVRVIASYDDGRYVAVATIELMPDASLPVRPPGETEGLHTSVRVLEPTVAVNRALERGTLVPILITQQEPADMGLAAFSGDGGGTPAESVPIMPSLREVGGMRLVAGSGTNVREVPGYKVEIPPEGDRFIEISVPDGSERLAKNTKNVRLQILRAGIGSGEGGAVTDADWADEANRVPVIGQFNLSVSNKFPKVTLRSGDLNLRFPNESATVAATSTAGAVDVLNIEPSKQAFRNNIVLKPSGDDPPTGGPRPPATVNLVLRADTNPTAPEPVLTKTGTQRGKATVQVEGFKPQAVNLNVRVVRAVPNVRLARSSVALHYPGTPIDELPTEQPDPENPNKLLRDDFTPSVVNLISGVRNGVFEDGYKVKRVEINHTDTARFNLEVDYDPDEPGVVKLTPLGAVPKNVPLRVIFEDPAFGDGQDNPDSDTKFRNLSLKVTMRASTALNVTNKATPVTVNRNHVSRLADGSPDEYETEWIIREIPIGLNADNIILDDWKAQSISETTKTRTPWLNPVAGDPDPDNPSNKLFPELVDANNEKIPPVRVEAYRGGIKLYAHKAALEDLMERGKTKPYDENVAPRNMTYRMLIGSDKIRNNSGVRTFAVNLTFHAGDPTFTVSLNSRTRIDVANPASFQTATVRLSRTTSSIDDVKLYPVVGGAVSTEESKDFIAIPTDNPLAFNIMTRPDNPEVVPKAAHRLSVELLLDNGQTVTGRVISVTALQAVQRATSRTVTLYRSQPLQGAAFDAVIGTPAGSSLGYYAIDQARLDSFRFGKPVNVTEGGTTRMEYVKYGDPADPHHGGLVLARTGETTYALSFQDGIAPGAILHRNYPDNKTTSKLNSNYPIRVELWAEGTYKLARDGQGDPIPDPITGKPLPEIDPNTGKVVPLRNTKNKAMTAPTVYNVRVNLR